MGQYDVAVIGGGIVGLATALALSSEPLSLIVLEAEGELAQHQTGHNSGVIHSGLYYKPGSLKAKLCTEGREAMYAFCRENGVAHERCGKLVVAVSQEEMPALLELQRRGSANGLRELRILSPEQIKEYEPHVSGLAGLWVSETGIVDYRGVVRAMAGQVTQRGGEVRTTAKVLKVETEPDGLLLHTTSGDIRATCLVNCAGLQSDRVAEMCGVEPGVRIVPFRGEYYTLSEHGAKLVRNLVYPVPDPRFPFLGVHFTRMVQGGVEAGPNAVLALARHGYTRTSIQLGDLWQTARFGGFWRMAGRHWRMGLGEFHRSFSKPAFLKALRRLMPELELADLLPGGAGVRAQAVEASGALVDDFRIVQTKRTVHVLNAPSPAATASLRIGQYIAALVRKR